MCGNATLTIVPSSIAIPLAPTVATSATRPFAECSSSPSAGAAASVVAIARPYRPRTTAQTPRLPLRRLPPEPQRCDDERHDSPCEQHDDMRGGDPAAADRRVEHGGELLDEMADREHGRDP